MGEVLRDSLSYDQFSPYLHTRQFGRNSYYSLRLPSTQILAHELAKNGAPEGTLVIAETQDEGRGRRGRIWHSAMGMGIWISLILRPPIPLLDAGHLSIMAALGVYQGLQRTTGLCMHIKWPNDILVGQKKICGILSELKAHRGNIDYVVMGIGINVNTAIEDWPEELRQTASSLKIELGKEICRPKLLAGLLFELERVYTLYLKQGFDPIKAGWIKASNSLGNMTVTQNGKEKGIILGLSDRGELLIQTPKGKVTILSAQ